MAGRDFAQPAPLTDDLGRPDGGHPQGVDRRHPGAGEQFELAVLVEASQAVVEVEAEALGAALQDVSEYVRAVEGSAQRTAGG